MCILVDILKITITPKLSFVVMNGLSTFEKKHRLYEKLKFNSTKLKFCVITRSINISRLIPLRHMWKNLEICFEKWTNKKKAWQFEIKEKSLKHKKILTTKVCYNFVVVEHQFWSKLEMCKIGSCEVRNVKIENGFKNKNLICYPSRSLPIYHFQDVCHWKLKTFAGSCKSFLALLFWKVLTWWSKTWAPFDDIYLIGWS